MNVSENLTGQRFGRLVVASRAGEHETPGGTRRVLWNIECDCGRTKTVMGSNLKSGRTQSCGHCWQGDTFGVDLTGVRFGSLVILRRVADYVIPATGEPRRRWLYQCDCGTVREVNGSNLTSGKVRSCGCQAPTGPHPERWIETTGYANTHRRVRNTRGRASGMECVDCSGPAAEWSYVGGCEEEILDEEGRRYCLHVDQHFQPRCKPDHRRYDVVLRERAH